MYGLIFKLQRFKATRTAPTSSLMAAMILSIVTIDAGAGNYGYRLSIAGGYYHGRYSFVDGRR